MTGARKNLQLHATETVRREVLHFFFSEECVTCSMYQKYFAAGDKHLHFSRIFLVPYSPLMLIHRLIYLVLITFSDTLRICTINAFLLPPLAITTRKEIATNKRFLAMTISSDDGKTHGSNTAVLVVGSANQDLTAHTDIMPALGETVMGTRKPGFVTSCGGKGANQAIAAALLTGGAAEEGVGTNNNNNNSSVKMVCHVGDDIFGKNLLANFKKYAVSYDPSTVVIPGVSTGVASILVDTKSGDNSIVVSPGANYELSPHYVRNVIEKSPSKPSIVVVQLEILPETALAALQAGKAAGSTTILNTAPAPEGWSLDDYQGESFYPYIDILIPNETELRKLCPDTKFDASFGEQQEGDGGTAEEEAMARSLLQKGVGRAVVCTLGERGALVVEKNPDTGSIEVTAVDAPADLPARGQPVVDTIGAGDAFCGALAVYLSLSSSRPRQQQRQTPTTITLAQAACLACGVASITVRGEGAQTSYPMAANLPACLDVANIQALVQS